MVAHPSDELYGADRILLQVLEAMRTYLHADVEVWLPDDVPHGEFTLCDELSARGIAWRHLGLPVLRRAYMRPAGLYRLARLALGIRREIRKQRIDILYCGTSATLIVAMLARLTGVRSRVVHIQERWVGPEAAVLRLLAGSATSRIAISQAVADAAGLRRPAPVIVENCVDDAATRATPADRGDRQITRYVVASRWNWWKGHATLLEAWERAGCPGHLTVLGGPPPVGDAVDVPALVDRTVSQPGTVDIVGEVADIAPYVAEADVLVLPSDQPEPFGLVVIEAFALGRPVIASRGGGPVEIIEHGRDGWLYELGDAASLADLLATLTPEEIDAAGRHARAAYDRRFHPDRYRRQIAEVLSAGLTSP